MEKIIIIGAGISGLFLANLLEKNGKYNYKILEKKNNVNLYDGYGLQISVNGIKLLNHIGFKEIKIHDINYPKNINFYQAKSCKLITKISISKFNDKDNYYTTLKRSTLINFLLKNIPKEKILYNAKVTDTKESDPFKIYLNRANVLDANYIAICDGVFSGSKSRFLKNESKVEYNESIALRGTIKNLTNRDISVYLGPNFHFVIYPVNQNNEANFISIIREKNLSKFQKTEKSGLVKDFIDLISRKTTYNLKNTIENVSLYPVYVSRKFVKPENKKVFLTGDALFAYPPSFAQGASQSIESSYEVFKSITEGRDDYYQKRALITNKVNFRSKINQFAFHASNPITIFARNLAIKYLSKNDFFLANYLGKIYK